jgi:hypothetical protein
MAMARFGGGSIAVSLADANGDQPKGSNVDTIADFSATDDTLASRQFDLHEADDGMRAQGQVLRVGKKAKSGKDAIIYNDKTGDILYDKNGAKKGGALLFAKLEGSPDEVSAANFLVV